jgi:hypothetical protein
MWLGVALLTLSCACPEKKVEGPAPVAPVEPVPPVAPAPAVPPTEPTPAPTPAPPGAALPSKAGETCDDKGCGGGYTCVSYYGIAGPNGPQFKSCEIPCGKATDKCPAGTKCVTIADGPGQVCR